MNCHVSLLDQPKHNQQHVNQFDADERHEQTAETIDQLVVSQQLRRADGSIRHTTQR